MDKKKLIIIAVVLVIIAFILGYVLGGMGKSKTSSNNKVTTTQLGDNDKSKEEDNKTQAKEPTVVNLGEKISNSDIEMTFVSSEFKDEIKWKTSEYSTMNASIESGKVGASISGTFKNLRGTAINQSNIIGKLVVDDKYTYEMSFKPHISGFSVEPLEDVEYDFYAQVPQEIKETYNKMEFIIGYNNDFESITTKYVNGKMTDKYENLDNIYSITVTK